VEAIGALSSYDAVRKTLAQLASPKAAALVATKDYETVAIVPAGAVYLMVRNKNLNNVAQLAGKKITTLSPDRAARVMVDTIGASMVAAEVGTFAGIFNNGRADACYAPATAVKPLELLKGMQGGGGLVKMPVAQLTLQIVVHRDRFDPAFGQNARTWSMTLFDDGLKLAREAERGVPGSYWIEVPAADLPGYQAKFREVRLRLKGEGIYDGRILTLMRRIRCKGTPEAEECKDNKE
jgi:hypothetical protein